MKRYKHTHTQTHTNTDTHRHTDTDTDTATHTHTQFSFHNILEYFDSFVRLTENLKLYTSIKLLNKTCQRTKEKSIKILSHGPINN